MTEFKAKQRALRGRYFLWCCARRFRISNGGTIAPKCSAFRPEPSIQGRDIAPSCCFCLNSCLRENEPERCNAQEGV